MSETINNKEQDAAVSDTVPVETGPIEIEEPVEFSSAEISRMMEIKQAISEGRYTDVTPEHRKLLFVQWMIEQGKLKS